MAAVHDARRPFLDGALPLAALVGGSLLLGLPWLTYLLASLYLAFATGMGSEASHRANEPTRPWGLYALGAAALSALLPVVGLTGARWLLAPGLVSILAGFYVHTRVLARFGRHRIGLLSAYGRRCHDARIGRTLEAFVAVIALATALTGVASAALFAVAGWLLTAGAVQERPDSAEVAAGYGLPGLAAATSGAEPAPAA